MLASILLEEKFGEIDTQELCTGLDIDQSELSASLKFWRGAGLLGVSKKNACKETVNNESKEKKAVKNKEEPENKERVSAIESAHKSGKVEREEAPSYSTEELTVLMEERKITADFIGEASRVYGKIFNQHEIEIIVRMIDYIGFDAECVLMLLSFYSKEKKTLRYIEKAALALYD